jgi:hypothetical protein
MAEQYTAEDRKMFAERDRRIVCQSSLERAVAIVMMRDVVGEDKLTLADTIKQVKDVAADLTEWVFAKAAEQPKPQVAKPPVGKQRSPSPEESRLLAMLLKRFDETKPAGTVADFLKLQKAVWSRYGKYPTKEESVPKLFKEIPATEILVHNDFVPEGA